ncbi:MAG TPA: hypothetical protein VMU18_01400 [Rhodoblastus sp.]|nr:hypothetical protein [Rhodoblastus sp.]
MQKSVATAIAAGLLIALTGNSGLASQHAQKSRYIADARPAPTAEAGARCAPASGAQILGGFAAPGDQVDSQNGAICRQR